MSSDHGSQEIVVCLGSSCFARGNSENLEALNQYVMTHGPNARIRLTGHLCQDRCKEGPNIVIGGQFHHGVTPERLRELLREAEAAKENHGAS